MSVERASAACRAVLGGHPVEVHDGYVVVPWYTPGTNHPGQRFARRLQAETGCVMAEVTQRRQVRPEHLQPEPTAEGCPTRPEGHN